MGISRRAAVWITCATVLGVVAAGLFLGVGGSLGDPDDFNGHSDDVAAHIAADRPSVSPAPFHIADDRATRDDSSRPVSPLPAGYVGVSMEYCEFVSSIIDAPGVTTPATVDPALANLIAGLAPGQDPILRIGGNSTDEGEFDLSAPAQTVLNRCPYIPFVVNSETISQIGTLASAVHAQLILGIPMKNDTPAQAAAVAAALEQGLTGATITAWEIGNEPDRYPRFRAGNGFAGYIRAFNQWGTAIRSAINEPSAPLAGPSLGRAGLPWLADANESGWQRMLHVRVDPSLLTFHIYPDVQDFCPGIRCPSIADLLSDDASHGFAEQLAQYISAAPARAEVRVDEMNSVTNEGESGVSDTFASALWALDTLFEFDAAGVEGVNVHTIPGAPYALFTPVGNGSWLVRPEYYGLLAFSQAAPAGSTLLAVSQEAPPIKVWATRASDGVIHIVVINKGSHGRTVTLDGPATRGSGTTLERLSAPATTDAPSCPAADRHTGLCATAGITLGGQTFGLAGSGVDQGDLTWTGTMPPPMQTPLAPCGVGHDGTCVLVGAQKPGLRIYVPAASADIITEQAPASTGG